MSILRTLFNKDLNRTLVTSISAVLVDSHTKIGVFKTSAAAKIQETDTYHSLNISVSNSVPYNIVGITSALLIDAAEPILVTFVDYVGNTITLEVNQTFTLNGVFDGGVTIKGKHSTPSRCSVIYS